MTNTKRIPKEYIDRFLESLDQVPDSNQVQESSFSIDGLINHGKSFYSDKKEDGKYIGTAVALEEALAHGSVATMPQLIAGKAQADSDNYLWKNWFTSFSEEVIGTHEGMEYLLIIHGGGVLTPTRIKQAIKDGLISGSAKLSQEEFDDLLEGRIVKVYDSINEVIDPFGHYIIKMPLETAGKTESGHHNKKDFLKNPLVLARNGGTQNLEKYFDKAKSRGTVGNYHWFKGADASTPQARLLFVDFSYYGLNSGYSLGNIGRFVGVARSTGKEGGIL